MFVGVEAKVWMGPGICGVFFSRFGQSFFCSDSGRHTGLFPSEKENGAFSYLWMSIRSFKRCQRDSGDRRRVRARSRCGDGTNVVGGRDATAGGVIGRSSSGETRRRQNGVLPSVNPGVYARSVEPLGATHRIAFSIGGLRNVVPRPSAESRYNRTEFSGAIPGFRLTHRPELGVPNLIVNIQCDNRSQRARLSFLVAAFLSCLARVLARRHVGRAESLDLRTRHLG